MIGRALLALGLLGTAATSAKAQRPTPGAPIDVSTFRYSRDLPAGVGLTALTLDAAALAHGQIDDIRIVDAERRQIPYVVERADSAIVLTLPAPAARKPATTIDGRLPRDADRRNWYRVDLPLIGVPNATLVLETSARVFRREITVVEGAAANANYRRVMTEFWSHDDPAKTAPSLSVSLPSRLRSDSLFLLVDDGDNDQLPITKATLRLPTYTLRFFRDSGSALRMVYGRSDLAAPRYDLALIGSQLKDSAATEIALGAERAVDDPAGSVPSVVFWSVLVATVLILLVLVARLVRGADKPTEPSPATESASP